jgi:hypothetical protein
MNTSTHLIVASLPLAVLFACSSGGGESSPTGEVTAGVEVADSGRPNLGNSECAHFCATLFGADTPLADDCTSQAAHQKGLCFECGPEATDGGLTLCGQSCVDPQTDVNNCGGCGNACEANAACVGGSCVCSNTPGRSYTRTCSGCTQTGNTLSCSCCLTVRQVCQAAQFDVCSCAANVDIANCNGVLECGGCQ